MFLLLVQLLSFTKVFDDFHLGEICNNSLLSWKNCPNANELVYQACKNGTWVAACLKFDNFAVASQLVFQDLAAKNRTDIKKLTDDNFGTHLSIGTNEIANWSVDLKKLYYIYAVVITTYGSYSNNHIKFIISLLFLK